MVQLSFHHDDERLLFLEDNRLHLSPDPPVQLHNDPLHLPLSNEFLQSLAS